MVHTRITVYSSFSVSLDLVWQTGCLITMDGLHFKDYMKSNKVVLTLFTFAIFKQFDQMVVAIDNAHF